MIKKQACIFPGSFNPFHEGHYYIVQLALKRYFKKIYIVISHNEEKQWHDLHLAEQQINDFFKKNKIDNSNIIVVINEGLTTDIMKQYNIKWIVRGYRNKIDLIYEKNLYKKYLSYNSNIKYKLIKSSKILKFYESKYITSKNNL